MALVPGTKLGPYEIVGPLGAGGMGEVYRARADAILSRSEEGRTMVKLVKLGAMAALAAALAAAPVPVLAKETRDDLKQEIEALKQGQQEILKQLEEIKKLVQARPSAPSGPNVKDVAFTLGNNPVRGSATAKLTIVEFTDYQ